MGKVSSFSLETDVINEYDADGSYWVTRWKGSRSVDVAKRQMKMSTIIDENSSYGNFGRFVINTDVSGGYEFEQAWTPGAGNTGGTWNESELDEETWDSQSQLAMILNLLSSANQTMLLGSEVVNGINCYVLVFTPSLGAVADWVVSQAQDLGPSLSFSMGPALVGRDMFARTYKGGLFQVWISGDTYLVVKARFSPDFEAGSVDFKKWEMPRPPRDITSDFSSQISFSNYDQPVSVETPTQATHVPRVDN